MKNKKISLLRITAFYIFSFIIISCSVEQEPIKFGEDECDYCQMTIVDNKYGAEIVNKQGKSFKFDAVECLLRYIYHGEIKPDDIAMTLVTDITKPKVFIDANNGYYLVSENIPSPMGAFLSAFKDKNTAMKYRDKYSGKIYTWTSINSYFKAQIEHQNHHH